MSLTASDLYALVNGCANQGPFECHWCGSRCNSLFPHDDNPVLPFVKSKEPCKRPGNSYICWGCWNWRRKRVTVYFLSGVNGKEKGYADIQVINKHSWLITEKGAWALRHPIDYPMLLEFLSNPTCSYTLSIVTSGQTNFLQLAHANDMSIVDADTQMTFTFNNIPSHCSVYELEHAIKHGAEGKEPGIQTLFSLYKPSPKPSANGLEKRGRGRPRKEEEENPQAAQRIVRRSGTTDAVLSPLAGGSR